jgi:molybdopterin molybdotransferase
MASALLSYEEAASVIASQAAQFAARTRVVEQVDLHAAAGRILGAPIVADRDLPPFPRSTRDGYACRASEAAAHGFLPVAGTIRAGGPAANPLPAGAVYEIMTGAPVPDDADAVIMLEHVEVEGDRIRLIDKRSVIPGENIVPRGGEARQGDQLLAPGIRLSHPQIALAAACGYATVPVFARPRAAILATGDELVPVDAEPGPSQIRNSNAPMLAALVSACGGKPSILPRATDDPDSLDAAIDLAAAADLLVISGGVSAGKFDLVEDALARAGGRFQFTGVRIQPGKPTVFGEIPRSRGDEVDVQPVFGLPGNPISSAVTFQLFVAPVLAALAGAVHPAPRFALARMSGTCKGKPGLTRFVPALCNFHPAPGNMPSVATVHWQGSGDLAAFARSNCCLVVPDGREQIDEGEIVRILIL